MHREGGFLLRQRPTVESTPRLSFPPSVGTAVNLSGERSTDVIRLKSQWEACAKKKKVQHAAVDSHGVLTTSKGLLPHMASAHEHRAPVSTVPPLVEQDVKFFNDGIPVEGILQSSNRTNKQSPQYQNCDQDIGGYGNQAGGTSFQMVYYYSILYFIR